MLGGQTYMASAERDPITGVWRQSPQRGPGPRGRAPGQRGEVSLKLKTFYLLGAQRKQQICLIFIRPPPYGPTPPPEKKLVGFV